MNGNVNKILVCKLKFYGDVLLTTPVIASLRRRYPDATIDLLLYKDTKAILSADPRINQFHLLNKKDGFWQKITNFFKLRKDLKNNSYDLIINLSDQWPIAYLLSSLHRDSIAFRRQEERWNKLFTKTVPVSGVNIVEQNLSILKGLDFADNDVIPELTLYYRESDYQSLFGIDAGFNAKNYIVIQPTARQLFKCWDDDKFAKVIDHLTRSGYQVVLTSGPAEAERQQVENIASMCVIKPNTAFAGKTTFLQLAALIDHAVMFIGVDSAPMHMAAALDTPQVCLFGATNYQQWRPWSKKATLLWAGSYHEMPVRDELDRSGQYLTWIPAEAVISAVNEKLQDIKLNQQDERD